MHFQVAEVERLLKIGSSIYSLDSEGDTPLDLASRAGNIVSTRLSGKYFSDHIPWSLPLDNT